MTPAGAPAAVSDWGVERAVRFARERRQMSARKVSLEAGLSESYVGKIEAGECRPSLWAFGRIARVLHMTSVEIAFTVMAEGTRPTGGHASSVTPPEFNGRSE